MKFRIPVWVWIIGAPGWREAVAAPDGLHFKERPPEMPDGSRVVAVEREGRDAAPGDLETVLILADARAAERGVPGDPEMN